MRIVFFGYATRWPDPTEPYTLKVANLRATTAVDP
jgi:hypothetical protein